MKQSSILTHALHRESLWRFLALIGLLVMYFACMSWRYDAATGAWSALLTWSFFVLCTPIADGGFIIAFPVRLLFGTPMIVSQAVVWVAAIAINGAALLYAQGQYQDVALTRLLLTILTTPWPYWGILAIAAAGTALSMVFGDEVMDVTRHEDRRKFHRHGFKHRILIVAGFAGLTIAAYYDLLSQIGIRGLTNS
jgi:hypothetical protein